MKKPVVHQWEIFCFVVELGSFSKVAEKMGTDVSFISKVIDQVEMYCGGVLFVRTKRGVRPTWEGEQYYLTLKPVIEDMRNLMNSFKSKHNEKNREDHIRLAIPSVLSPLFIRWVTEFEETSLTPTYVEVMPYEEDGQIQSIQDFDWVVSVGSFPTESVVAELKGVLRLGVAARQELILGVGKLTQPEELLNQRVLSLEAAPVLVHAEERITLKLSKISRVYHWIMLLERVKMMDAFAVGVPLCVLEEESYSNLERVLCQWELLPKTIWLFKRKQSHCDKRKQVFEQFLHFVFKQKFV